MMRRTRTVFLVRHCAASGQEPDAPLTQAGREQAIRLAAALSSVGVRRVVSSPYRRALETAQPLAERLGLSVVPDERLIERVLSPVPLPDWRERLAASYSDLDLCLDGGESSRAAMKRGCAALADALAYPVQVTAVVTHGNLLTLLLKSLDPAVGLADWERMTNPDVYRVEYTNGEAITQRITDWTGLTTDAHR